MLAPIVSFVAAVTLVGGITTPGPSSPRSAPSAEAALYQTGNNVFTSWSQLLTARGFSSIDEENQWGMAVVDGYVDSFGRNQSGQLGDGTTASSETAAVRVTGLEGISEVDGGRNFGLGVTNSGRVYSWGSNQQGDLGNGPGPSQSTPEQIRGLDNVVEVSAGNNHSLALLSDGQVMAWGDNSYGDLGIGTTSAHETPVLIGALSDVVAVSAGCDWSLALLANGTVEAWGLNRDGQLGDGTTKASGVPVVVAGLPPIKEISAGGNYANNGHALALTTGGKVYAWGDNSAGQLGVDNGETKSLVPIEIPNLSDIASVSAGGTSSLATGRGQLWVWGSSKNGQLGTGSTSDVERPTLAPFSNVEMAWSGALGSLVLVGGGAGS